MSFMSDPVDAGSAKKRLRAYALALPAAALIGGWCTLLQIAWYFSPEGIVDHIPDDIRSGALILSIAWLFSLVHGMRSLPGIIDDILERGIVVTERPRPDAPKTNRNRSRRQAHGSADGNRQTAAG